MFKVQYKILWASLVGVLLFAQPLMAGWSMPPEVIYPSSSPYNATYPYIASDVNGNSIAVWFDITGSGSMQAATLASGAVNGIGQPAWALTNPVATSNVLAVGPYNQSVGVDGGGNAIAVWTDGTNVYIETLPFGQMTWTTPLSINTPIVNESISEVYIAVAQNGNAIVTWYSSVNPYDGTIFANVYNGGWLGQVNLTPTSDEFDENSNPVAVDPNGNGIVGFTTTSGTAQAFSYNVNSNTWTAIPSVSVDAFFSTSCAMDSNGNGTIVWLESDNTTHAAILLFGQSTLSNATVLSSTAELDVSNSGVVTDAGGNAVAVWPDASGALGSARYSFAGQTWNVLPLLNLSGNTPYDITLSGDGSGNVVATWVLFNNSNSYIQAALLPAGGSSWTLLSEVSPMSDFDYSPQVSLTTDGDAVVVWENDINPGTGTIESSIFLQILPEATPSSPSFLTGSIKPNKFLTQIVQMLQLKWGASPDTSVVSYNLYANGHLINTQPAGASTYSYQSITQSSNPVTYVVTAVNSSGSESAPLFLILR